MGKFLDTIFSSKLDNHGFLAGYKTLKFQQYCMFCGGKKYTGKEMKILSSSELTKEQYQSMFGDNFVYQVSCNKQKCINKKTERMGQGGAISINTIFWR
jgi:hypothetical protein